MVNSTPLQHHRLGISVAEGLENPESLALLKTMKCAHIQGYFLAKPITVLHFLAWLKEEHNLYAC